MGRITETVKHLIIINILLFIAPKLLQGFDLQNLFALHFPENPEFGIWQYVTHMFMHSQQSFMHILFNMYGLWAFGTPLEQMWGKNKFLFFYFSAGLGAGAIYTLVNYYQFSSLNNELINLGISTNEISQIVSLQFYDIESFRNACSSILQSNTTLIKAIDLQTLYDINGMFNTRAVGASGAIYGILVAFGLSFPNSKLALIFLPVPIAAKYFIPALIALDLFSGVTGFSLFGGGIAHFAHVGGALIGFIIAWYWKQNQFKRWN